MKKERIRQLPVKLDGKRAGMRMISSLAGSRLKVAIFLSFVCVLVLTGILLSLPALSVSAAEGDNPEEKLECLSCHTRGLFSHDRFGPGNQACWTCHDGRDIGTFMLLDGTQIKNSETPEVCAQCHAGIKNLWDQRRHGVVTINENGDTLSNNLKVSCTSCHNPHNPGIDLADYIQLSPLERDNPSVLRCLTCHSKQLSGHDKLGEGSDACRACHSNSVMGELHLAGKEGGLSLRDSPLLCGQCHQARYDEWQKDLHGSPAWKENEVVVHGQGKVSCIGCHDPHQPQITLVGITIPHPEPVPEAPELGFNPFILLGIAVLAAAGVSIVVTTRSGGL